MTQKPLYRSLDANLALLEEMFGRSDDFYTKRLMLAGIPCAIVMFTGLSSPEKLCHMALDMLDRDPAMLGGGEGLCDYLLTQSRVPAEPDAVEDRTALVELLSNGLSVLLIDGVRRGVAFSTQEMPQRSISTPMGEGNLRGPQEAFTELLRNNISLLRRQFRTGTLVAEISTAGPVPRPNTVCATTVPWPQRKPSTLCGSGWSRWRFPFCWTVPTLRRSSSRTS